LLRRAGVLIRIARKVRVTLSDMELQFLHPGEFYDVPPAVGRVLVSEGWAVEPDDDAYGASDEPLHAAYDDPDQRSTS
jgi:hypothetical protein